jgi:hypothetical protein
MTKVAQIQSARAAGLLDSASAVATAGASIWAFCVWCGHAQLFDGMWLTAQAKSQTAPLVEIEARLKCMKCERHGVRLILTPRTMVGFDKMSGY